MFNIIILCISSMLSYISKEMISPILPLYLTGSLGLSNSIVGLIEGISKSLSSIVKFYSGYFSDKKQDRKKFVVIGFLGSFFEKMILAISNNGIWVLIAKLIERFGKGIRSAPKDAIIADAISLEKRGSAFGIQKMFDKFGAVIGIIIAYILVKKFEITDYKNIFIVACIPSFISIFILFFLKQNKDRSIINIDLSKLNRNIQLFFIIAFISSIGNSTKSFLLLKATSSGFNSSNVILLYLIMNLITCLLACPIGKLCDNMDKKIIISLAYLIFGLTYLGFGMTNNHFIIIILFLLYGLFIALISIGAKSFILENTPSDMKATALGINECLIGLASLPASIIAGFLWDSYGAATPFYFSAGIGIFSFLMITFFLKKEKISE